MDLPTILVTALPGLALIAFGAILLRAHRRAWREQQDGGLDTFEQQHFRRRYRRRTQIAVMLILLGAAIPPGMLLLDKRHPKAFGVFWMAVLIVALWIIALAIADAFSTRSFSKVALSRLDVRRKELESQLQRMKSQAGNGTHYGDDATTTQAPPSSE